MNACITRETSVFTVFWRVFHSTLKLELCRHACRRRDPIISTCRYGKNKPATALILNGQWKFCANMQKKKHIKVHFWLIGVFDVLCATLWGNGPVEGAITCTVKHKKVYFSKTHPNFFLIFAENVRLLFLNIIKFPGLSWSPWGPQPQSIKSSLSPCDNRRVKWQHENKNK